MQDMIQFLEALISCGRKLVKVVDIVDSHLELCLLVPLDASWDESAM